MIISQLALRNGQNRVVEHSGLENNAYLCGMNFTSQMRYNPETGEYEKYLCQTTDDLFKPTNRIMLFDLTNFYFEGRKDGSRKARFGRSKEKRSDCKLLVLALCINTEGFIRYSAVLEGNTTDPKSLPDMVDRLIATNPTGDTGDQKVLVVIDAGIASQDNLDLIKQKKMPFRKIKVCRTQSP